MSFTSPAFTQFSTLVAKQFAHLAARKDGREVFVVGIGVPGEGDRAELAARTGDALWATYLAAFPAGTDPLFKKRTEHDCSCCKSFLRRVGALVAVRGGAGDNALGLVTVWDEAARSAPYPYNVVAERMRERVASAPIVDLFRVGESEKRFGAEVSRSASDDGAVHDWHHFHTGTNEIPKALRATATESADSIRGKYRSTVEVFERGLRELSPDAVETVLGLIDAPGEGKLYRGEEKRAAVVDFQAAQKAYAALPGGRGFGTPGACNAFLWTRASNARAAHFKNDVIGTLVEALSKGEELDDAVRKFESMVAPSNYKRTTSLVTPAMVKKALEEIERLGLGDALERRFARIEDVGINDVLWVDSGVRPLMRGGALGALEEALSKEAAKGVKAAENAAENAQPISLGEFMRDVLPTAGGMEALFKGEHLGNLCSLTAPAVAREGEPWGLFKWGNDFAWSYAGNVADSIKERVKKAGGRVTNNALRVSLSWFNFDDLDLHVWEPGVTGRHIHFRDPQGRYGFLDVDMNAGFGKVRDAVENVAFGTAPDGAYRVVVNNFARREAIDVGFTVEVENGGKLQHFSYPKPVRDGRNVEVCTLHVKGGRIERVDVGADIETKSISQERWGLTTEQFVKVNAVMLSPNYWASAVENGGHEGGNKHHFFVLDGAKNDEPTRGIYNEFLHPRLEPYRKVFELIGDKTKCQPTGAAGTPAGQLSGLGFSSTKAAEVVVRVFAKGKQSGRTGSRRLYAVKVGG